jgi:homospermidine synthase
MIGFGSIGKGTLPLIERHFEYDKSRFVIIDPHEDGEIAKAARREAQCASSSRRDPGQLSRGAGAAADRRRRPGILRQSVGRHLLGRHHELCRELGALYIDTVNEPWLGFYFDFEIGPEARSNYALRETTAGGQAQASPGGPTAVSCCGANPGMVSWFVKQALLDIARDTSRRSSRSRKPRRLGPADAQGSASRASTSPSATPSAPRSRSR